MFEGSRHVAPYEHTTRLADAGAMNVNATTDVDGTSFYETVPSNQLELALWLESDRLGSALDTLDQHKLDSERKIVENEIRERIDEVPYGGVDSFVQAVLFPAPHPYHHGPLGDIPALESVTLDDVRSFFDAAYRPSQCTLALVGDVSPSAAHELVAKYFATLAPGVPSPSFAPSRPARPAERRLVIDADVPRPRVVIAWAVVPQFAPGSAELEIGASQLGGWLDKELVEDDKVATRVWASMQPHALASTFEIVAELDSRMTPAVALAAIDARLHEIRAPRARFDRVGFGIDQARFLAEPFRSAERLQSRASLLQLYNEKAGTPDYADTLIAARRDVRVEDVRKAFYDLLPWDGRVVALVNPRPGAPLAGRLVSVR
jgi:predicted Zn-dependent peptidase